MFSWSSTSRKGGGRGYPAANNTPVAQTIQGTIRPPEFSRQQHLESYRNDATLQRSTRKVSQDDTTYDTVFQTTSGEALILRVHLPSSYSSPPQMTLVGCKATHPWLDARMKLVGYAPLQSEAAWKSSRLLLGQAVHEVVKHLQLNPPSILEMTDPGLAKLQQSMGSSRGSGSSSQMPAPPSQMNGSANQPPDYDTLLNSLTPPPPVDMPSVPNQFPDELNQKSREELQTLLDDELEFLSLVHQLPVAQEMQMQRTSAVVENAKLATTLLEREEEYTMLHGAVSDLKSSLVPKLQAFDALKQEQEALVKPPDWMQMKRELHKAKKQAENVSEDYAMAWVESGDDDNEDAVNVQTFLKEFLRQRNEMHMRAAKLERLEQQQKQEQNAMRR
mmetsp:Transcript_33124/g.54690  ORF Transcript_33124/g.54690 Transcript_33124/m.54690 type:complete len:389 (-) Transcript_33124:318-1484(-)